MSEWQGFVLITFVYILNARLQNYIAQTFIFRKPLCKLCQRNGSQTQTRCAVFYALSNDIQQTGAQARQRQNGKN